MSEEEVSKYAKKVLQRRKARALARKKKKEEEAIKRKYKKFQLRAMRRHMNLWKAYQTMDDGLPEGPGPFVEEEANRLDDDPNDVDFAKMAKEEKEKKGANYPIGESI